MDQFAATFGRRGHAIKLDCRSLAYEAVPLDDHSPDAARLVICNTMIRHALAGGEYNVRRAQCEAGVRGLARHRPEITSLRDVSAGDLEAARPSLEDQVYRRCHHVIHENDRVVEAAAALRAGDPERLGALMHQSHVSLRDDYEVSCRELDVMVSLAMDIDGVYGARMTGGGFGGCTVNLVRADATERFTTLIAKRYHAATGLTPTIHTVVSADGAGALDIVDDQRTPL